MDKTSVFISIIVIFLVAGNVYQFQNPNVVEVPSGTEQIDSTSWVQKDIVLSRNAIIDSLEEKNQAMADRIDEQQDKISSYTSITGRLKTQVDSLKHDEPSWNSIPLVSLFNRRDSISVIDTTFHRQKTFGNNLFQVDGYAEVEINLSEKPGLRVRQDFELNQIRDIQLDVVHTVNDNQTRSLTYVTSPDFESLDYQSSTELEPKNELPWFWIGLGTGVGGALLLLN